MSEEQNDMVVFDASDEMKDTLRTIACEFVDNHVGSTTDDIKDDLTGTFIAIYSTFLVAAKQNMSELTDEIYIKLTGEKKGDHGDS